MEMTIWSQPNLICLCFNFTVDLLGSNTSYS